jgi:energy-coupling factor transporter ATP-binding protein EcfA2
MDKQMIEGNMQIAIKFGDRVFVMNQANILSAMISARECKDGPPHCVFDMQLIGDGVTVFAADDGHDTVYAIPDREVKQLKEASQ